MIDSEPDTVDAALARNLAAALRTTVFWTATSDAANSHMIVRFGSTFDWDACATRGSSDYYDQLDASDEWSYLRFDKVPYAKYETTPSGAPGAAELSHPTREVFLPWPVLKPPPKLLAALKAADVTLGSNRFWLRVKYKGVEQMLRWTGKEPVTAKRVLVALTSAGKIYKVQYTRADGIDETVNI
jgi:hypothetical protein